MGKIVTKTKTKTVVTEVEIECAEVCGLEFTRTPGTVPFFYKDRGTLTPAYWNDSDMVEFSADRNRRTVVTIYGETEEDVVAEAIALTLLPNPGLPEMP